MANGYLTISSRARELRNFRLKEAVRELAPGNEFNPDADLKCSLVGKIVGRTAIARNGAFATAFGLRAATTILMSQSKPSDANAGSGRRDCRSIGFKR